MSIRRTARRRHRAVAAVAVIFTVTMLAILSHNLLRLSLIDYQQGAQLRDTIALQHLTESALGRALYYLNRGNREAAGQGVAERFGSTAVDILKNDEAVDVRIVADAPNADRPRSTMVTLFRLARDGGGPWRVVAAEREPIPMENSNGSNE